MVWLRSEPIKLPAVVAGYELASLLTQLMRKKTSGRITLSVGETERTVQMMRGVISSIASKQPNEHLVARFGRKRRLNKEQKAAVQEVMEKENLRFGAALVRLKIVDSQMFASVLGEHHAFLLGLCLRAKGVRVTLDTDAKGPADRAPLRFLDAVEKACRKLPFWQRRQLASMMAPWEVTLTAEDLSLAKRLDPTPIAVRILSATPPEGVAVSVLQEQAGGRSARAALHALYLSGLLRPTEASLLKRPSRVWPFVATASVSFAAGAAFGALLLRPAPLPPAPVVEPASVPTCAPAPVLEAAPPEVAPAPVPLPPSPTKKKRR